MLQCFFYCHIVVESSKFSHQQLESSEKRAMKYVDKAIKQSSKPFFFAQKATLLFLLGQIDESIKCFEKVLKSSKLKKISPSLKAEVLNNYACSIAKAGQKSKALSIFEGLELDKDYLTPEVALVNQARIHYEGSKLDISRSKLELATKFAPDYVDAHYYLGLVCYSSRMYRTSLRSLNEVIRLEPKHQGAIFLRDKCCKKLTIC
jgi:tetratricopeptide (TPR) repeat protein